METFSQSSYESPVPSRFVFHLTKPCPGRVNSFLDRFWGTPYSNAWSCIVPVPPCASNLIV